MKSKGWMVALALTMASLPSTLRAQQGPLCPGLTGQARTNCLQAEVRRAAAAAATANAKLDRLNNIMKKSCDAVEVLDATAQVANRAGEISANKPLQYGGMTWTSVRNLMTALTKERRNCDDARKAVAAARKP